MLTDQHFTELEEKGYTVVEDAVDVKDCDAAIAEYQEWISHFGDEFPDNFYSLIFKYNVAHMAPTWRIRLKAKPVFAQLWKTEKLLSSMDAISIGRPPEGGGEEFQDEKKNWLHVDFTPARRGLHAYQGAVYLDEQTDTDWTFQVLEGSHKRMNALYDENPTKANEARKVGHYYPLDDEDVAYFKENGYKTKRVPVPKGGIALWDSRLVHANAKPLPNRKHAGRWRHVVFVSMTPAIWASDVDLEKLQEAYNKPAVTMHWSSQGVIVLDPFLPTDVPCQTSLPDVARTDEARKLAGVTPYDFHDGTSNGGDYIPVWEPPERHLDPELDMEKKWANGHI